MNHPYRLPKLTIAACVATAALLAACNDAGGYYDAQGRYIPYTATTSSTEPANDGNSINQHNPRSTYTYSSDVMRPALGASDMPPQYLNRRGYYDYNGNYVTTDLSRPVPTNMFPPKGMCRIWFTDRAPNMQTPVESCDYIGRRVPSGAYVIYGG